MILPTPNDGVGEHARTSQAALDRKLDGLGAQDLGRRADGLCARTSCR
jgi:hypothetical protein